MRSVFLFYAILSFHFAIFAKEKPEIKKIPEVLCGGLSLKLEKAPNIEAIEICKNEILFDLAEANFMLQKIEFQRFLKRSQIIFKALEEYAILTWEKAKQKDRSLIVETVGLLRSSSDRVLILFKPDILSAISNLKEAERLEASQKKKELEQLKKKTKKRRKKKKAKAKPPEAKEDPILEENLKLSFELVKRANRIIKYSYFDQENMMAGIYLERGRQLLSSYLKRGNPKNIASKKILKKENSKSFCKNQRFFIKDDQKKKDFKKAHSYFLKALELVGRSEEGAKSIKAKVLTELANLQSKVYEEHPEELNLLKRSLKNLKSALALGSIKFEDRIETQFSYGKSFSRLACKLIEKKQLKDALTIIPLAKVSFSWPKKETILLNLAQNVALPLGYRKLSLDLLESSYNLVMKKRQFNYFDLVENEQEQFYATLFKLDNYRLKSKLRKNPKSIVASELIADQIAMTSDECSIVSLIIEELKKIKDYNSHLRAESLKKRVRPVFCPDYLKKKPNKKRQKKSRKRGKKYGKN